MYVCVCALSWLTQPLCINAALPQLPIIPNHSGTSGSWDSFVFAVIGDLPLQFAATSSNNAIAPSSLIQVGLQAPGTGFIHIPLLSPGTVQIVLTVLDTDGNLAQKSFSLTVNSKSNSS